MAPPVFPAISGLTLSRPPLPRRKKPITIAHITITAIIIALIIGVTITIAAITENLMLFCLGADRDRSLHVGLTPAQEAAAVARRKEIFEELHPETRAGACPCSKTYPAQKPVRSGNQFADEDREHWALLRTWAPCMGSGALASEQYSCKSRTAPPNAIVATEQADPFRQRRVAERAGFQCGTRQLRRKRACEDLHRGSGKGASIAGFAAIRQLDRVYGRDTCSKIAHRPSTLW